MCTGANNDCMVIAPVRMQNEINKDTSGQNTVTTNKQLVVGEERRKSVSVDSQEFGFAKYVHTGNHFLSVCQRIYKLFFWWCGYTYSRGGGA